MPRNRQIYQTDLLYVGPTGARPATGGLTSSGILTGLYGNTITGISGVNFVAQLYRIQKIDHNWTRKLTDVNQFGELAAIDRVTLDPPTVSVSLSYLLNNFINEDLMGITVNKAGDAAQVSCLSGILNTNTSPKNYFIKTVNEGNDAADNNQSPYDVISFGNAFIASYTSQGSVGNFPTVDITLDALNAQMQSVTQSVGAYTPAVNPNDGTALTGYVYTLPTGLSSFNNATTLTAGGQGISVLRPGDIVLTLGTNAGDGFVTETDLKIQSYNVTFNTNNEDLKKLGTKFVFAKLPRFPLQATLTVNAMVGDHQTGSLVEIVNNNVDFNPAITIYSPGSARLPANVIAYYQLKGAKLESQDFSSSIGANKTVNFNFTSTIGGPQDVAHGLFLSGVIDT